MAEQLQHTSAQDDRKVVVRNRHNHFRGIELMRGFNDKDSSIWHHLIFCEEPENDDLQHGAFCWLCDEEVVRGTPAYKCLECYFLQHKSCVDQPHGLTIERRHILRFWKRHHLIFIKEDLQDKGGEESKKFVCSGCKEPTTIGRDPAYKCSMPRCTFLLHKSCSELPTLITHPLHVPDPDPDHILLLQEPSTDVPDPDPDHIFLLQEPSTDQNYCSFCLKDCNGSLFYSCKHKDCRFNLHPTCAPLLRVNADDCQQHKLLPLRKQVHVTCESCGEETKDIAYLCSECRVLIHGKCAQFQHTIKTTTHDHTLTRTYSSSHQLDVFCKLCYKKLNTEHTAYYCCRECDYVAHLDCANTVRDSRPPNKWVPINSVDYQTHLVHLVEGINLAHDERVSLPEILHFSHPQHNLILSNEEPIDDMRCEACVQFIISTPFYGCTQCKFFLHDRCARLPRTIQRGIFHEHSLTLLSQAPYVNGLYFCKACKSLRHGFTYSCSECRGYNLDVQCCLIPETLKHKGHQHPLFFAIRSSEPCNVCSEDCDCAYGVPISWDEESTALGVRFVCIDCNFTLCITCATIPLVAKYQYERHLLELSYTREDYSEEYYCIICEEERNHPDHWFYYCVKCKFTAHWQCILGKKIKSGRTYIPKDDPYLVTIVRKTMHSPPCDTALECTACKPIVHKYCLKRIKKE